MAYETDYLRELDLFDFPSPEERLFLQPPPFAYSDLRIPQVYPQVSTFGRTQQANQDDFLGLAFDLDDSLFNDLDMDTLPLTNKRPRDSFHVKMEPNVSKKRRLVPLCSSPSFSEMTSTSDVSSEQEVSLKFKTKQKRTKWLRQEVQNLWEGIATYGNNWRLIKKKAFGHRTYYQVKDKGRRILSSQGWSSGRTKATHDGAAEEAKMIAEKVLLINREEENSSSKASVTGSTSSPSSASACSRQDFDFDLDFN